MPFHLSLHTRHPLEGMDTEVDYPGYVRVCLVSDLLYSESDGGARIRHSGDFTFPECKMSLNMRGRYVCTHFAVGESATVRDFNAVGELPFPLEISAAVIPTIRGGFSLVDVQKVSETELEKEAQGFITQVVENVKKTQPEVARQLIVLRAIAKHLDYEIQELDS